MCAKSLQSCPTLCNPRDYSLPGSSVHGILHARILEWVAISFSRKSSQPRDQTCISDVSCIDWQVLYHEHHLGSPKSPIQSRGLHAQRHKRNRYKANIQKCGFSFIQDQSLFNYFFYKHGQTYTKNLSGLYLIL